VFPNNLVSAFSVDSGATSAANGAGKFDIHMGSINNMTALDLRLRVGELTDQTRSLQNNNVLVVDGEKADIQAGTVDYFQIPTGNGQTSMSSVSYLLSLEVTPHITVDGAVQMVIKIENNSPTKPSSTAAASMSTRSLTTNMLKKSGETAVIGGMYTTDYQDSKQGIPILQDIPILGWFFQSLAKKEARRELIILITPTIVSATNVPMILSKKEKGSSIENEMRNSSGNSNAVDAGSNVNTKESNLNENSLNDMSNTLENTSSNDIGLGGNSNSGSDSKENQSLDQGNLQ
jgi:type II secretory pathway component GspD/PulD (secretin)